MDSRITVNELDIIEIGQAPTLSPGVNAPIGSIALLDGGARKWQKFGALDTDWKEDNVAGNTSFDNATNDYAATNVQAAIEESRSKADYITYTSWTGDPKKAVVVFNQPYPVGSVYSVVVSGKDNRTWTIENDTEVGFTINANANMPISSSVFWSATLRWS